MNEERITRGSSWSDPRGQVMKTPDDVAEMLRLRACGWGLKRIARELGCSHHTVKGYVAAGGVKPFKSPERPQRLHGLEGWLRERFIRHRGNADVVRQDLLTEKGVTVSRRTLQRRSAALSAGSWRRSDIRDGSMCKRSGPRSKNTGLPGSRAHSPPSAVYPRKC
ncbi:helix-turn-helix domain-containing protein [Bradyrhizobium sp. 145]|nr:helix-turn-helix domain-containing protein [Bradyrhizobium sp. 145]